ncbi:hypothetical protein IDH44_03765 [Paenibacillus sp. IB182496]|uniref:Tissue inhibitor of metalloproteinase n=1 Tax=Paenibacillus sabuli TaxID=2772509 RepID=A0A927BR92_9BACL|nr:hypothetical protein [Paenibacillus sabuli]MBD2844295.1 hypothetical protein [Paenibacillus sabuli]
MTSKIVKRSAMALIVTLLLAGAAAAPTAYALDCAPPPAPERELGYAELVFKGTVTKQDADRVHFDVARLWKGTAGRVVTLSASDWVMFDTGGEYLVFASNMDGRTEPLLCGNTGLASLEAEQALGEPIPLSTAPERAAGIGIVVGAVLVLGVVLVAAVLVVLRYRRVARRSD